MTFFDDLNQGVNDLFDIAGKDAVYTPENGYPQNIRVIFRPGATASNGAFKNAMGSDGRIRVRKFDIPDPEVPGVLEIEGNIWTISGIIEGDGDTLWELSIKRDIKPTFKR
ncbi:MAG: hypothetical protein KJ737_16610 [Proteobacteria bacterium]|nr:hypothetical protein [Pseudomonadota bacterium]